MKNIYSIKKQVKKPTFKKLLPSQNNRLLQYMNFSVRDWFIAEYVDFLTFYWEFLTETMVLWCRDNDAWANFYWFHLARWNEWTWRKNIILKVSYYYEWNIIDIGQLNEFSKDWKKYLRVQIYGKGLLILNRENLRENFNNLLLFFGLREVFLTRIDYAVDCKKINFKKKNTLNARKWGDIKNLKTWEIEYTGFGSKGVSPLYLRYYNKKRDLKDTNYEWLYPEYDQYDQVMRYELQVNSDWISPNDKETTIDKIESIARFGQAVNPNKRSHKTAKQSDENFKIVQKIILQYKKTNNKSQLLKLQMLLDSCQVV